MACPQTAISLMPLILAGGTMAAGSLLAFLSGRAREDVLETNPQARQKAMEAARPRGAAPVAARKPRVVTRMKDLKRLAALLAAPGRRVTATDTMLVLTAKEATIGFAAGEEGAIAATLMAGDGKRASAIVLDAQARYVEAVKRDTTARVVAQAPRVGWKVAARETARDGSIAITLQKARAKKAVAIG